MELAGKTLGLSVFSKCLVQFSLLQMGKLRPGEGKGLAWSHRANWEQIVELNSSDSYMTLTTIVIIYNRAIAAVLFDSEFAPHSRLLSPHVTPHLNTLLASILTPSR